MPFGLYQPFVRLPSWLTLLLIVRQSHQCKIYYIFFALCYLTSRFLLCSLTLPVTPSLSAHAGPAPILAACGTKPRAAQRPLLGSNRASLSIVTTSSQIPWRRVS